MLFFCHGYTAVSQPTADFQIPIALLRQDKFRNKVTLLPDHPVHIEENTYCEDDCRVLNEGKLVGCPTVVP